MIEVSNLQTHRIHLIWELLPDQFIQSKDKDRVHTSVAQQAIVIHILFQPMGASLKRQFQTIGSGPNALLPKQWMLGCNFIDVFIDVPPIRSPKQLQLDDTEESVGVSFAHVSIDVPPIR